MKTKTFISAFVLLYASLLFAQNISLTGTVKNCSGEGIEGVTVSLTGIANLTASTDSDGAFSLINGVKTVFNQVSSGSQLHFQFYENLLIIPKVSGINTGMVEIFLSNGKRSVAISLRNISSENQRVALPQLSSGLHLVRITLGTQTYFHSFLRLEEYGTVLISRPEKTHHSILVKASQNDAVDTLIVTKSGYPEVRMALDSYVKTDIEIVMGEMPLVYDKEWMGENCPMPDLVDDPMTLPEIEYLPDPFLMADGTTRMTSRLQWICRRAEIKAILEKYDAGIKPGKPDKVEATLSGNTINITCTEEGKSLTLKGTISYANGTPSSPVPAIIGVAGGGSHSLQFDFKSRGIAEIAFDPLQVMDHSGGRTTGSFYKLYPDLAASGGFIRWAWAFSRFIDALEILPEAQIDVKRLAVSGCSYAGKVALFCGAWDERVALTLTHESGGGGTISWRYSDMLEDRDNTEVENLHHAQGVQWYAAGLKKYEPISVSPNTLPYDHHELIGMIAPRAVLCIESSQIARMGAEAARIDALAAREIWKALGVPYRMGATEANVSHCMGWTSQFTSDVEAYVEKFLLGNEDVDTDILRSRFTNIDVDKWIPWDTPELQ